MNSVPSVSAGIAGSSLEQRFVWITGARLLVLTALLSVLGLLNKHGKFSIASFTIQTAVWTLAVAFALTAVFTICVRAKRGVRFIVPAQLISDQLMWTVVVYLSGGASSGATSFYGLSCLTGAILAGFPGATIAGVAGGVCFIGLLVALYQKWLVVPPDQPVQIYRFTADELLSSALLNILVIIIVVLLAGNLSERLRRTGGALVLAMERADQAERMAALGRLAAGLAHEIRNPLGSIRGSIQMLKGNSQLNDDDRRLCAIVEREASRLNDLVTDMLDLSRPRRPAKTEIDVVAITAEVVRLAGQSGRASSDVEIVLEVPPSPLWILADGAQVRQLLWNLVRNAVQASNPGRQVVVEVGLTGAAQVVVSIRDFGTGLGPEAKDHIFDAFYTTRSQGTGIGLAVVKRIADEHGFTVTVDSAPGEGAEFRVDMGPPLRGIPPAAAELRVGSAGQQRSP